MPDPGYLIEDRIRQKWLEHFTQLSTQCTQIHPSPRLTRNEVEQAARELESDINEATASTCWKWRPFCPKAVPWWSKACTHAASQLRLAQGMQAKRTAATHLKGAVRAARCTWANHTVTHLNIWEVAVWCHGQRQTKAPPIRGKQGLTHNHTEMASIFSHCFFIDSPPDVPLCLTDYPPPQPHCPLPPIQDSLIRDLLNNEANMSALGNSGHTWKLLKWVWAAMPDRITSLIHACIQAGHHPHNWKEAMVCVIPKPGQADYTVPKNFQPISLLECMGKLVEITVVRLMYQEIIQWELIPTNQFGGRMASSTVDAGLCLDHDVQNPHTAGLRTGICLFNISGFFNNVNCPRLSQLIQDLGFAPEIVNWSTSFLSDRSIHLKFNSILSDPLDSAVRTLQGSPISPVLSVIYTYPLLLKAQDWNRSSLGMYVDNGVLFACARNWEEISETLTANYTNCVDWLTRSGLMVEPDKTELLFFRRQHKCTDPPTVIHLQIPSHSTYYHVKAAMNV